MTTTPQLSVPQWLELSPQVRNKLTEIFNIPRSTVGNINYTGQGTIVTSDGRTHEDLKAISVEAMQSYLKSQETDYFTLFNKVLDSIRPLSEEELKAGIKAIESRELTQEETIEAWKEALKQIKLDAESKGLLGEYKLMLKAELKPKYAKPIQK